MFEYITSVSVLICFMLGGVDFSAKSYELPGQGPRSGAGGPDSFVDENAPAARFYRVKAALP
jgi:hypothetical protein